MDKLICKNLEIHSYLNHTLSQANQVSTNANGPGGDHAKIFISSVNTYFISRPRYSLKIFLFLLGINGIPTWCLPVKMFNSAQCQKVLLGFSSFGRLIAWNSGPGSVGTVLLLRIRLIFPPDTLTWIWKEMQIHTYQPCSAAVRSKKLKYIFLAIFSSF